MAGRGVAVNIEVDFGSLKPDEAIARCAQFAKGRMLDENKRDLADFRVAFDIWSRESDLYTSGLIEKTVESLRGKGELYEEEGALWIKTSSFGDDKDRVIKRSDGQYTYFAPDIAYHIEKWKRGFTRAINIWGADHHGYVQRMKAALKSNGIKEEWLSVLVLQLVKLWRGGEEVKMSKRAGLYVTLRELVDEARKRIVNVPLHAYAGDNAYEQVAGRIFKPFVESFKPQMIFVSIGFDAHWSDPLTTLGLSTNGYLTLAKKVVALAEEHCDGRIVFVLEGGYDPVNVASGSEGIFIASTGRGVLEVRDPNPRREPDCDSRIEEVRRWHGF